MHWGLIKAIIILPGTVLVFVPTAILLLAGGTSFAADFQTPVEVTFYAAGMLFAAGGYLAIRTVSIFTAFGEGTPAPWEPCKAEYPTPLPESPTRYQSTRHFS